MLTEEQIKELRELLENAQNPLFLYDNDADGLCSFLLLRRYLGRGMGAPVRSYPKLDAGYAKSAVELKADVVFVLDKPVMSEEFVVELDKMQIPLIWIDHHTMDHDFIKKYNVKVFNPAYNTGKYKGNEPVTALVYSLTNRKEDMWIAVMGCVADHYLPDFAEEFGKDNPEYWGNVKTPFEAYFKTEIGRLALGLNFGLKDRTGNIIKLQNYLVGCKSPSDVLAEEKGNREFRARYKEVKNKYDSLIEKADKCVEGNLLFFSYAGDLSISGDLSNELCFKYPKLTVVVAYKNGGITNVSMRGKNVNGILGRVLKKVEGAGGGHEDAVGLRIKTEDTDKLKQALIEEVNQN